MSRIRESRASNSSNRRKKTSNASYLRKSILTHKRTGVLSVIYEGEDLTPDPLPPSSYDGVWSHLVKKVNSTPTANVKVILHLGSKSRFQTDLQKQTLNADGAIHTYTSVTYIDDIVIEPEQYESSHSGIEDDLTVINEVPGIEVPKKMPTHISLILVETPTFFILEMPSKTVEEDSEEAPSVEAENERYLYLTEGKGRNRKVVHAEVQTVSILLKTRSTQAKRSKRKHNDAFASNWEMYDTYLQEAVGAKAKDSGDYFEEEEEVPSDSFKLIEGTERPIVSHEDQMIRLLRNSKFQQVLCIMERLLANNNFNEQQKRFRGLSDPDPFREHIEYNYRLNLLWTFANKETYGRCVSSICWNEANTDILGVGYGKFYYSENTTGMVYLWNIKNPTQPERAYRFENPVTAIDFSKHNPNLLAIGFYTGNIFVLDVSSKDIRKIAETGEDSPSFEPVWQVKWQEGNDYYKGEEQIIATNEDGRVHLYRLHSSAYLTHSHLMRIMQPEGKLKGVEIVRKCHVPGIPITRYAAGLTIEPHPVDSNIYYVGANEGTIHKCSKNHFNQHLDLFLAHDGPVYAMKFSPFCNRIFLTCGDDWHVRIWAEGIVEPLFELSKTMNSVQDADWSPTLSTVLANICGTDIYIWDLQRKTHLPQSITRSPTNSRNTILQFTKSGRCLLVGDIDGNVHIFSLEDMPFPAFFQDDLLTTSIIRGLITRPDLIKQLEKYNKLSFDKEKPEKDNN